MNEEDEEDEDEEKKELKKISISLFSVLCFLFSVSLGNGVLFPSLNSNQPWKPKQIEPQKQQMHTELRH
jgi:flagellar basal body-associated protein FliL